MLVTVHNRGPEEASLHVLPQLWFRNTWSWNDDLKKPSLNLTSMERLKPAMNRDPSIACMPTHSPPALFCENETNMRRLFGIDAPGRLKTRSTSL